MFWARTVRGDVSQDRAASRADGYRAGEHVSSEILSAKGWGREVLREWAGTRGNFELYWRGSQTVGPLQMKIVSTPSKQAIGDIIAAVFEVKKEIPA